MSRKIFTKHRKYFFLISLVLLSILLLPSIFAAEINDSFHINLQTTDSSGFIETGTFNFAFNITENSSASCGGPSVYNHSVSQATDSRGIASLYLPTIGSGGGNLSSLDYGKQYYLCYSRDGTLKDVSQLGRVPYSFRATQVNLSDVEIDSNLNLTDYNITDVDTGFFDFLGSIANRITGLFVQDIDASGEISVGGDLSVGTDVLFVDSTGDLVGIGTVNPQNKLNVVGDVNATETIYAGEFSGPINWTNLQNYPAACGANEAVQVIGDTLSCIEVASSSANGTGTPGYLTRWVTNETLGDSLIYQNGTLIGIRTETPGATLDVNGTGSISGDLYVGGTASVDGDLDVIGNVSASWFSGIYDWVVGTASQAYLSFNGTQLDFNEAQLNTTIDLRDDDTLGELGCSDTEIAKWNATSSVWECSQDLDTDTLYYAGGIYIYKNNSNYFFLNETKLNTTIDLRDDDTTYDAGTGLNLSGTTFSFDETYGDLRFVNENQVDSITSAMILDGDVGNVDLANSTLTIIAGTGLTGGGSVALGGETTLNVNTTYFDNNYINEGDAGTLHVDMSDWWNTGDQGALRNISQIQGSWINNDLAWINFTDGDGRYVLLTEEGNLNVNRSEWWRTSEGDLNNVEDLLGSWLTNDLQWINFTQGDTRYILLTDESNLNVNSSDFWITNEGIKQNVVDILGSEITNDLGWINGTYGNSTYILKSDEGNLNVNSSDFWDGLNTPADITGLTDTQIEDVLTINASGSVSWSALTNYPAACSTSETITVIGDTIVCSNISITESQISDLQNYIVNNTGGNVANFSMNIYQAGNLVCDDSNNCNYIPQSDEGNLNVNSSDFWDGLNTPSDISTGDLTDDNTYVEVAGDTMTGNLAINANLSVGTDVLFVDNNGGLVGIGTVSPQNTLSVAGDINATDTVYAGEFSGPINWTNLKNYPAGCAAGEAVQVIGDTLTCINISAQGSDTLDGYDSSFFMPLNKSVYGTFDFNDGWTGGGLTIDGGDLYAQTLYVYNITSLNVTNLNINGSLLPQEGYDNTFDVGAADRRWRDLYLGRDASVGGDVDVTGNVSASWFSGIYDWVVGTASQAYLSFNGTQLDFDETQLNTTIDSRITDSEGTLHVNMSDWWNTGDQGALRNISQIQGSWINNDLAWINFTDGDGRYILLTEEGNLNVNRSEWWRTSEGDLNNVEDILGSWITNDLQWINFTQGDTRYILLTNESNLNVNSSDFWITDEGIKKNVVDILGSEITNDLGWVNFTQADPRYVNIDGDTMTGGLTIAGADSDGVSFNATNDLIVNDTSGRIRFPGLDASRILSLDSNNDLASILLANWIAGTSDQIIVNDDGNGGVTLSLPQDINTTSSPTFSELTLSNLNQGSVLFAGVSGSISQNNSNFFWNETNTRLGIGTSNPQQELNVEGNANVTESMYVGNARMFTDVNGDVVFRING